jgi:DNA-binding NarL/FixJ family response regulator
MTVTGGHNKVKHKVCIVDDHPIVRQGLALLINQESDLNVCCEASDMDSALLSIEDCRPDIAIIDLSLGQESGLRLIENISTNFPFILMLVLSMHDELVYAERCIKAGAKGYIMKQEPPERVIVAIRKVLNGEVYVSETMSEMLIQKFMHGKSRLHDSPVDRLSNRELEVFQLIGQGLKTRTIAGQLNLSVKTIETYIEHIKKKMNFSDSRKLFLNAVQWVSSLDNK